MTGRHGACAALLIASAVGGASCISPGDRAAEERAASTSQAIIGGSADTSDSAIVALVQTSTGNLCSGTLVAPTLVLTAAHCVSGVQATDLQVLVGATTASPSQTVAVTAAVPYPTYDSEADGIPGGVDLGFVTLASALSVTPVPVRTDTTDADLTGADVTVIGFGVDDGTDNSGSGTRRGVSLSVSQVCSRLFQAGGEDANACEGDSGGAVLLGGKLVGLVSGGNDGCFAPTTFMRTDAHADWITAVLAGGSAATCPTTCTSPDPSCGAATETRAAASDDAGSPPTDADDEDHSSATAAAHGGCTLGTSGAHENLRWTSFFLCGAWIAARRRARARTRRPVS